MKKAILLSLLLLSIYQVKSQGIYIDFHNSTLKPEGPVGFENTVVAQSMNMGASTIVSYSVSGGGSTVGKPVLTDIMFQHASSANSAIFNWSVTAGQQFQNVDILFTKLVNGNPTIVYKISLENVILTSYSLAAADDCSSCAFGQESISLTYTKITWNDPINKVIKSYDRITNK